jgi:hypothetical protein
VRVFSSSPASCLLAADRSCISFVQVVSLRRCFALPPQVAGSCRRRFAVGQPCWSRRLLAEQSAHRRLAGFASVQSDEPGRLLADESELLARESGRLLVSRDCEYGC